MRIILQDWTFWVCAIVCSVWVFKWTAGHTDDIKLQGWLVVGLNCQVWNWRVFFKVWNYFYSLTHSKERYKVYKRGRDPWSRHVPNSWEAAVSAAPFLIRALLLRTPRPKLKEIILNLFFRVFFGCCKPLIASVFINRLEVKLITKVEFSQRYKDSFITFTFSHGKEGNSCRPFILSHMRCSEQQ